MTASNKQEFFEPFDFRKYSFEIIKSYHDCPPVPTSLTNCFLITDNQEEINEWSERLNSQNRKFYTFKATVKRTKYLRKNAILGFLGITLYAAPKLQVVK